MNLAKIAQQDTNQQSNIALGITVKCYSNISVIKGYGSISIDAREIVNIDAQHAVHVIGATITTGGDYPQTGNAAIAYADIERICAAIDRIRGTDPSSTKFNFIEAEFHSGDLKIVVFNMANGNMMFSAEVSGAAVHMDISKISELKAALQKAKNTIDTCKQ